MLRYYIKLLLKNGYQRLPREKTFVIILKEKLRS